MKYLVMDFETRSTLDLKQVSHRRYAAHPSTDILCIGLKWNDRPPRVHVPVTGAVLDGTLATNEIEEAIRNEYPIVVHNRSFEENIYYYICHLRWGWPAVPKKLWYDTMASCSYYAIPRSLKKAGPALGLETLKDVDAGRELDVTETGKARKKTRHVLTQVSKPRKPTKKVREQWLATGKPLAAMPPIWWEDPARLEKLYGYCRDDVVTQDELFKKLGPLPRDRMNEWRLDCEINERGVPVDWCGLHTANEITIKSLSHYNRRLIELTSNAAYPNGMVQTIGQRDKMLDWIALRGINLVSMDKAGVEDALARTDLPEPVREMLTIRQEAGKSSIGKLEAMLDSADDDSRIRDTLVWHGAATGRKAGQGIQPQNFPNECLKDEDVKRFHNALRMQDAEAQVLALSRDLNTSVPDIMASALRSFIMAEPGNKLCISDLSNIEARVLAWVADCAILKDAFATGKCPYTQFASRIYNIPMDKIAKKSEERQLGKVAVLGLGYGMGGVKFKATAAGPRYKIELSEERSEEIVKLYRETYPEVRKFWFDCDKAFREAIKDRTVVQCGKVSFGCNGDWGWITLPSGRPIWMYKPMVRTVDSIHRPGMRGPETTYWGIDSKTKSWVRRKTYGGSLVESICQATAGCLLQAICERSEKAGYPVIFTVHDEVVSEVPDYYPLDPFHQLVKERPNWCLDLPIECESHETVRYGK